ncbi:MAG: hypothetical protein FWF87_01085 [Synergistaceae bacterium]|nr:hypothetical protein [Synergistaceae bacterium]
METEQNKNPREEPQPETKNVSLFAVGSVLSRSWNTLLKNPVVFFALSFLVFILIRIIEYSLKSILISEYNVYIPPPRGVLISYALLKLFFNVLLWQWISGAFAYGVYQTLKGNKAYLGESLLHGTKRIFSLFCIGLLSGLGYVFVFFLGSLLNPILGLVFFFMLMCMWAVAIPVCAVERLGAVESMSRSSGLTKGCRMKILGIIIVAGIFTIAIGFVISLFEQQSVILNEILRLVGIVPMAFGLVTTAVTYYSLLETKEGKTVDSLANVFD